MRERSLERAILLLPGLLLLALVVALPILRVVHLSLCRVELDGGIAVRWAGFDQFVRLWDVPTGHELRHVEAHLGGVLCVAFTHDGRRLLLWKSTAPMRPARAIDLWKHSDKPVLDLWMRKTLAKSA